MEIAPTAQPIVLFYGLTQAARAVVAARAPENDWNAAVGHGLKLLQLQVAADRRPTFTDVRVRDDGQRFFQQFAGLIGSPTITGAATLAELVCSLPEMEDLQIEGDEQRPIKVFDHSSWHQQPTDRLTIFLAPLPPPLLRRDPQRRGARSAPTPVEIVDWIARYPTLAALGEPIAVHHVNPMDVGTSDWCFGVQVSFRRAERESRHRAFRALDRFLDVASDPVPGVPSSGVALPRIAENIAAMKPLVTWWAILYACSMLARYEPRVWTDLLDVDSSKYAVPTEIVLGRASIEVPRLLAAELTTSYNDETAPTS